MALSLFIFFFCHNCNCDDNLLICISPLGVVNHIAICMFYKPSRSNWQLSLSPLQTPFPCTFKSSLCSVVLSSTVVLCCGALSSTFVLSWDALWCRVDRHVIYAVMYCVQLICRDVVFCTVLRDILCALYRYYALCYEMHFPCDYLCCAVLCCVISQRSTMMCCGV